MLKSFNKLCSTQRIIRYVYMSLNKSARNLNSVRKASNLHTHGGWRRRVNAFIFFSSRRPFAPYYMCSAFSIIYHFLCVHKMCVEGVRRSIIFSKSHAARKKFARSTNKYIKIARERVKVTFKKKLYLMCTLFKADDLQTFVHVPIAIL